MNETQSKQQPASFDQPMHTPGPWETSVCIPSGSADAQWDVCMAGGGDRIAALDDIDPQETEANARLIAAAPELLAALDALLTALHSEYPEKLPFYCRNQAAEALDALAKARGE